MEGLCWRGWLWYTVVYVLIVQGECRKDQRSVYWEQFGNDNRGSHFSSARDITKENVHELKAAWSYKVDTLMGTTGSGCWSNQNVPIMVDDGSGKDRDVLIVCTPFNKLVALEPTTGQTLWEYSDASFPKAQKFRYMKSCRGVASWTDPEKQDGDRCRRTVFMNTAMSLLAAIDAATGLPCPGFGNNGIVNITRPDIFITRKGKLIRIYANLSPPVAVKTTVAVGETIRDGRLLDTPKGLVRGYDTRTGQQKWTFSIIPVDRSDPAFATWGKGTDNVGSANAWAPMSADEELGLFFVATSGASGEHYGGHRPGSNEYSDSIVALEAETGRRRWHYQLLHHDIWNYDLSAQPSVTKIQIDNTLRTVVLVSTKWGALYVLDALTGQPVFPVREVNVPQSRVPGEVLSSTQPLPTGELSNLTGINFTYSRIQELAPEDADTCRNMLRAHNIDMTERGVPGLFPALDIGKGVFLLPGEGGGGMWFSQAVHPDEGTAVFPMVSSANVMMLLELNATYPEGNCLKHFEAVDQRYKECVTNARVCLPPPWGQLVKVDLRRGKILWRRPHGEEEFRGKWGNYGSKELKNGVVLTASGLVFGAGRHNFWSYDYATGHVLWKHKMSTRGCGVPITFRSKGQQFVAMMSLDPKMDPKSVNYIMQTFSLPSVGAHCLCTFQSVLICIIASFIVS